MINSFEWCWEIEQSEDGMVTCRFDHMEDVEGFDKSFVQDRGHIGVVRGETGKWGSKNSACTLLSPVMEPEKLVVDGEGAYGSWEGFSFLIGDSRACSWYIDGNESWKKKRWF